MTTRQATAIAAALFGPLAAISAAQEPTCDFSLASGYGHTVCYEPGYAQDAELARDILDLAAQRFMVKYGAAGPFDLAVKLYAQPTGRVRAGYTYFDGSAIHYLAPSAPERAGRRSSLGLPQDSTAYHNGQRPANDAFQQQYRRDAARPWTTDSGRALISGDTSGFSGPLFTGLSSPPFQWRARSCPWPTSNSSVCSNWSNVINWSVASCARTCVGWDVSSRRRCVEAGGGR